MSWRLLVNNKDLTPMFFAVHASAQFALGETVSGEYLLRRFKTIAEKETLISVVRKAEVKYKKAGKGDIKASAIISDDVAEQAVVSIEKRQGSDSG